MVKLLEESGEILQRGRIIALNQSEVLRNKTMIKNNESHSLLLI